jgi:hypothetical protein
MTCTNCNGAGITLLAALYGGAECGACKGTGTATPDQVGAHTFKVDAIIAIESARNNPYTKLGHTLYTLGY